MSKKTLKGTPLFLAKANGKELQIEMYDSIGADWFGEGITPKAVSDVLKGSHESVTLRINSPGGVAHDGIAIYNILRSHGKPVNVIVDGVAASAASIIAMAGDTITMGKGTTIMIHPAMMMTAGDAAELRKQAEVLDQISANMADIYVARTGQSKDQVTEWMNAETWMDPAQAMERGFATATSDVQAVASLQFDLKAFGYKNIEAKVEAPLVVEVEDKGKLTIDLEAGTYKFEAKVEEPVVDFEAGLDILRKRISIQRNR